MIDERHSIRFGFRGIVACALLALTGCTIEDDDFGSGSGGGGNGGSNGSGNPLDVALTFEVHNDSATERTETLRATVPFPRGGYLTTANLIVSGFHTAWLPMQFWPDGTIKMAQAQFTDTLAPNEQKSYEIARDETAMAGPFTQNDWVRQAGAGMQLGAEVEDTFGVAYRGVATGAGETLQETPLVRVQRWRTYHEALSAPGIGRDYLSSVFYTTEFRDMPFVVVDWVIGNDYLGADDPGSSTDPNLFPLGPVDVTKALFLARGHSGLMRYMPDEEGMGEVFTHDGYSAVQVMTNTFIDDCQTRRYRFLLRFEPGGAPGAEVAQWQNVATAMLEQPMFPLASHQTWKETAAAGLLGGPVDGPSDATSRALGEYQSWIGDNHFGTWGSHGDLPVTATTGTPRNHPLSPELAHAIQGNYPRLLQKLENMAWIQAVRPYHYWGLTVGAEERILLWDSPPVYPGSRDLSHESRGRRAIVTADPYPAYRTNRSGSSRAHGWYQYDHEHFAIDLLFDYWCISGDEWAKEEIRVLGECLKGLMRISDYGTANVQAARAEGWCMQAFAQTYQVTHDEDIKTYAMRRVNEVIEPGRNLSHASRAMKFQSNYTGTKFPFDHEFFMPWQHGAVLYGFIGAYRTWEEPKLLEIAEDVLVMLDYSWVRNFNDPNLGLVENGLRYYVPVTHNHSPIPVNHWDLTAGVGVRWGSNPLGGVHTFLTIGLYHLAAATNDSAKRVKALEYGGHLLGNPATMDRWNKWNYCLPEQFDQ